MSQPNALKIVKSGDGPPQSSEQYNRDRRMSHPITPNEVQVAKDNHQARVNILEGKKEIQEMKADPNMKKYDQLGMYPAVERLVAVGDLHGDLKVKFHHLAKKIFSRHHLRPALIHQYAKGPGVLAPFAKQLLHKVLRFYQLNSANKV